MFALVFSNAVPEHGLRSVAACETPFGQRGWGGTAGTGVSRELTAGGTDRSRTEMAWSFKKIYIF